MTFPRNRRILDQKSLIIKLPFSSILCAGDPKCAGEDRGEPAQWPKTRLQ